jgi:dienelactone hydrolase
MLWPGIVFEDRLLGEVPALIARPAAANPPWPAVLWFHGFTADRNASRPELGALARAGFLAIGIDAVGHGARRLPDFDHHFSGPRTETDRRFLELVTATVAEVPGLFDNLRDAGLADERRLAVAGVSMGGYISYGAVVADRRIQAAVPLLGSPEWPYLDSPHFHPDRFFPTALLSIASGADTDVPPENARAFHRVLKERYRDDPDRLCYIEIEGAPHMMHPADWARAVREAVGWIARFCG